MLKSKQFGLFELGLVVSAIGCGFGLSLISDSLSKYNVSLSQPQLVTALEDSGYNTPQENAPSTQIENARRELMRIIGDKHKVDFMKTLPTAGITNWLVIDPDIQVSENGDGDLKVIGHSATNDEISFNTELETFSANLRRALSSSDHVMTMKDLLLLSDRGKISQSDKDYGSISSEDKVGILIGHLSEAKIDFFGAFSQNLIAPFSARDGLGFGNKIPIVVDIRNTGN